MGREDDVKAGEQDLVAQVASGTDVAVPRDPAVWEGPGDPIDEGAVTVVPASDIRREAPPIYDDQYLSRAAAFDFDKAGLVEKVVDLAARGEGADLLAVVGSAMKACLVEARLILPIQGSMRVNDEIAAFIRRKLDMSAAKLLADGTELSEVSPEFFVRDYVMKDSGFEMDYLRSALENAYLLNTHQDARVRMLRQVAHHRSEFQGQVSALTDTLEEAEQAAKVDALTELPNRRGLQEYLGSLANEQDVETAGKFAVVWLDGDKFKSVNDRWGHDAGDTVLKNIARILREQGWNFVARMGGEEFVLVRKFKEGENLQELGEQVRAAVAAEEMQFTSSIGDTAGQEIKHYQTVSVGVASGSLQDLLNWKLIKGADAASFHSKAMGRNKVTVYEEGAEYKTPTVDESR